MGTVSKEHTVTIIHTYITMSVEAIVSEQCGANAKHGSWVVLNGKDLSLKAQGNGVVELKNTLKDEECSFVLLCLRLTLQGVPNQARNIWMHWKGPSANGFARNHSQQNVPKAMELLKPNHGQLEVIGKTEFTEEIISKKWEPNAGSHTIE